MARRGWQADGQAWRAPRVGLADGLAWRARRVGLEWLTWRGGQADETARLEVGRWPG